MKNKIKRLVESFAPTFDETTLFVMAISFMALWPIDAELRSLVTKIVFHGDIDFLFLGLLYFSGVFLAAFHLISNTKKSEFEKFALITFAVATNAAAGFFAGSLAWADTMGFSSIAPMLCVLNACLLITFCMHGIVDETNISDENTQDLVGPIIGASIVLLIIFFTTLFFRLHWSEVYSMCIVYATNINTPLLHFVKKKVRIK